MGITGGVNECVCVCVGGKVDGRAMQLCDFPPVRHDEREVEQDYWNPRQLDEALKPSAVCKWTFTTTFKNEDLHADGTE